MLQPRTLLHSNSIFLLRASHQPYTLLDALSRLSLTTPTHNLTQHRHASHATQGRANGPKQGPGKRLGAKRAASELVVPGCIIFRQRGAKWWPGENCVMGRDHTISSLVKGYVRYYRDPENHPSRKLIGVVFEQHETLPRGRNMSRRRRLGLVPRVVEEVEEEVVDGVVEGVEGVESVPVVQEWKKPAFTDGYQYRPSNTQIGRAAKESGRKYPVYKPHDRWLAWRLRSKRKEAAAERRALKTRTSKPKKKSARAPRKGS